MRKIFLIAFLVASFITFSQEKDIPYSKSYLTLDYLYGNVLLRKDMKHLATEYPSSFLLSWNKRTFGDEFWEQDFNYPDIGITFGYQDFNNAILGKLYAIYGHYNFYFFNRKLKNKLILSIGAGLAYNTNPHDKVTNNKNIALGTHLLSSGFFKLYYQRENIFKDIGVQGGFTFIHASNGSFKAPNKGINSWGFNFGLNYNLGSKSYVYKNSLDTKNYKEPFHFNAVLYTGFNEADFINSGIKPFVVVSFFADKRLNRKSALQFGTELHLHYYLKKHIQFQYIFNGDVDRVDFPDWKRISLFAGYELFINKTSIFAQLGYYVYTPKILNEPFYQRIGLKRYFNHSFYTSISLKAYMANAESFEFGLGYRF